MVLSKPSAPGTSPSTTPLICYIPLLTYHSKLCPSSTSSQSPPWSLSQCIIPPWISWTYFCRCLNHLVWIYFFTCYFIPYYFKERKVRLSYPLSIFSCLLFFLLSIKEEKKPHHNPLGLWYSIIIATIFQMLTNANFYLQYKPVK